MGLTCETCDARPVHPTEVRLWMHVHADTTDFYLCPKCHAARDDITEIPRA